ncbi:MAG: CRISPR-associated CARF protein Csa3 [Candidatus Nezhaarchaeota archaeon]|nr:CRISPR-associated CARF protein Csa3 [Candidatus Nezhaarchaeota archaeon]
MSSANRVLVLTLGFDEKFAIRALMRHGEGARKVLIVTAEPMEERAQRALSAVEDFLKRFMETVEYEVVSVDPSAPYEAMRRLRDAIEKSPASSYIINVSGGMRALTVELLAVASLMKLSGGVEVELEILRGTVSVPIGLFYMEPLGSEEYKVLRALVERGPMTVTNLVSSLGIPRSSLYRYIKELKARGLVEEVRKGRSVVYESRDLARVVW